MSHQTTDDGKASAPARQGARSNGTVVLSCVAAVVAMGLMSYAAVPLYRLYCQVTGSGGTTQRSAKPSETVIDRRMLVRFDSNVSAGMPWRFEPMQRSIEVKVGENALVFYRATNTSDRPITGTATFNVAPDDGGIFFSKIECFCFKEQTLAPGESVEMPVSFYIDPAIAADPDAKYLRELTLSYTFYPVDDAARAAEVKAPGARGG